MPLRNQTIRIPVLLVLLEWLLLVLVPVPLLVLALVLLEWLLLVLVPVPLLVLALVLLEWLLPVLAPVPLLALVLPAQMPPTKTARDEKWRV